MAVFLFTWHAYRSWMPDRPEGYVVRGIGVLPPDERAAEAYAERALEEAAEFDGGVQRTLVETLLECREPLGVRVHAVATDASHLHALVSWTTDRTWESVAKSLRTSLTRALRRDHGDRIWFSDGRSRRQVQDETHFEHLMTKYLPEHRGWFWSERDDWRAPIDAQ